MTAANFAQSYLIKAGKRLKILELLLHEEDYSDVVREAQEIVELSLKAMLRFVGIEPPKIPDVGGLLLEHRGKFSETQSGNIARLAAISKRLRKDRELAFYGDIDFIPTEEYTIEDAKEAIEDATFTVNTAKSLIEGGTNRSE